METYILLLEDRKLLENIENIAFEDISQLVDELRNLGMDATTEDSLAYYSISEFMDLVNDQVLDNLTDTFIGYIQLSSTPTLYYSVPSETDNRSVSNGLREICVYQQVEGRMVVDAELLARSDFEGKPFYNDLEEIQFWLDIIGDETQYKMIKLKKRMTINEHLLLYYVLSLPLFLILGASTVILILQEKNKQQKNNMQWKRTKK